MSDSIDTNNARYLKYRKRFFFAEFAGAALLLLGRLPLVIFMLGAGSAAAELIPSVRVRQSTTGFLLGCIGAAIAISPIGKVSGAHVNPAVTVVFWRLLTGSPSSWTEEPGSVRGFCSAFAGPVS